MNDKTYPDVDTLLSDIKEKLSSPDRGVYFLDANFVFPYKRVKAFSEVDDESLEKTILYITGLSAVLNNHIDKLVITKLIGNEIYGILRGPLDDPQQQLRGFARRYEEAGNTLLRVIGTQNYGYWHNNQHDTYSKKFPVTQEMFKIARWVMDEYATSKSGYGIDDLSRSAQADSRNVQADLDLIAYALAWTATEEGTVNVLTSDPDVGKTLKFSYKIITAGNIMPESKLVQAIKKNNIRQFSILDGKLSQMFDTRNEKIGENWEFQNLNPESRALKITTLQSYLQEIEKKLWPGEAWHPENTDVLTSRIHEAMKVTGEEWLDRAKVERYLSGCSSLEKLAGLLGKNRPDLKAAVEEAQKVKELHNKIAEGVKRLCDLTQTLSTINYKQQLEYFSNTLPVQAQELAASAKQLLETSKQETRSTSPNNVTSG